MAPNNHDVALSGLEIGCSRTSHVPGTHRATDPDLRAAFRDAIDHPNMDASRGSTLPPPVWDVFTIDEVRSDLAVYIFKGVCGGQRASVQVTTKFPVEESYNAYRDGRIRFRNIDVNVNAPVTARFDSQSQAYVFDLPYLFRVRAADGDQVYTLNPRTLSDRYVPGLTKILRADTL